MDELKKGRNAVLEYDHTVIIGWSEKTLSFVEQLCMGHELSGGTAVRPPPCSQHACLSFCRHQHQLLANTCPQIIILSDQEKDVIDEQVCAAKCRREVAMECRSASRAI